jgi:hypothetical protein
VRKMGEVGFRERARRYAATDARGLPDSAASRDTTSHPLQFWGSSRVAFKAA